jgi:hypothetical protein
VSAPPTRADLIASSGGHHCGSRARRRISRTQRRANGRGYIFSSCPVVWVAGGCSGSSSRSRNHAIRSGSSSLRRCRPPGFQIDIGYVLPDQYTSTSPRCSNALTAQAI